MAAVAAGVLAFLVVGFIVLHVLVGLVLLPFQIGFALLKGMFALLCFLPVLLVVFVLGVAALIATLAIGGACLFFM